MALVCGFSAGMVGVASHAGDAPARLVVVNAVYGDLSNPAATTNVTAMVAAMVNDDTLDFRPSNEAFGGDPAPGLAKQFKVDYTIDGVADTKTGLENRRLKISAHPPAPLPKSRLVIVKAIYGDLPNGESTDVVPDLTDLIQNDGLKVLVNDRAFGDPAFGKVKKLRVDYKFGGRKKSISVKENETLKLPTDADLAEHRRWILSFWIISGIVAISAIVTAVMLLARKQEARPTANQMG